MRLEIDLVLKTVVNHFELTPKEMFKLTRKRDVVYPRHLFFYLSKKWCKKSLEKIGIVSEVYGRNKPHNHASVIHGIKRITEISSYHLEVIKDIEDIEKILSAYKNTSSKPDFSNDIIYNQIDSLREVYDELEKVKNINIDLKQRLFVSKNEGLPEDEKHLLEMYRNVGIDRKNDIMFKVKVAYKMQEQEVLRTA